MTPVTYSVLHVEDDPNDVLLLQRAVRKANLPIKVAAIGDGELAIAYLTGEQIYSDRQRFPLPDLILLDLKIPRRSGLEVLTWVRRTPHLRRIPIVVLTSSRHERDINDAYDAGVNSYLVKPVGFDSLLDIVKAISDYWLSTNQNPAK